MPMPRWVPALATAALLLLVGMAAFAFFFARSMQHLVDGIQPALAAVARQPARVQNWDSTLGGTRLVLGSDTLAVLAGRFQILPDSAAYPDSARISRGSTILGHALGSDTAVLGMIPRGTVIPVGERTSTSSVTGILALFADSGATLVYVTRPQPRVSAFQALPTAFVATAGSDLQSIALAPTAAGGRPSAWLWLPSRSQVVPFYDSALRTLLSN